MYIYIYQYLYTKSQRVPQTNIGPRRRTRTWAHLACLLKNTEEDRSCVRSRRHQIPFTKYPSLNTLLWLESSQSKPPAFSLSNQHIFMPVCSVHCPECFTCFPSSVKSPVQQEIKHLWKWKILQILTGPLQYSSPVHAHGSRPIGEKSIIRVTEI